MIRTALSSSELQPGLLLVDLSTGSGTLSLDVLVQALVGRSHPMRLGFGVNAGLLPQGGLVLDVGDSGVRVQLSGTSRITATKLPRRWRLLG